MISDEEWDDAAKKLQEGLNKFRRFNAYLSSMNVRRVRRAMNESESEYVFADDQSPSERYYYQRYLIAKELFELHEREENHESLRN